MPGTHLSTSYILFDSLIIILFYEQCLFIISVCRSEIKFSVVKQFDQDSQSGNTIEPSLPDSHISCLSHCALLLPKV